MAHPPGSAEELLSRCACELEHIETELAKREWQPIETAPRDGTRIDVWQSETKGGEIVSGERKADAYWGEFSRKWNGPSEPGWVVDRCSSCGDFTAPLEGTFAGDDHTWVETVTHWLALPEPPR